MSDANGFVERPKAPQMMGPLARLVATAENGQAVVMRSPSSYYTVIKARGLRLRSTRHGAPDGMVIVWCEKIAPTETPA